MDNANVTSSRGTIIKVPDTTPGVIYANGKHLEFKIEGVWKSPVAPAPNQTVDLAFSGDGCICAITVVDSQQLAKERLNLLGGAAQEHGKEAAKLAKQGVGAMAARMGKVAFGAAVLVWIVWFLFPAAGLSGGGGGPSQSYTFWSLLGTDFSSVLSLMGSGTSHGLFSMIGLIAILAPFAAPFIPTAWARYLNAAPLAYVLIAWIAIYLNQNKAFSDLAKIAGASPFSFSWGIFLLAIAAVVLAAGALRQPAV
jgi:hypothetical protein